MSRDVEEQVVVISDSSVPVVESLSRAEIDIQIATARKFPRDLVEFQDRAMSMATPTCTWAS